MSGGEKKRERGGRACHGIEIIPTTVLYVLRKKGTVKVRVVGGGSILLENDKEEGCSWGVKGLHKGS